MTLMTVSSPACLEREIEGRAARPLDRRDVPRPVVLWGNGFLLAYMAFHGAHVAGRDPSLLGWLSPIPLFACAVGSTCAGALLVLVGPVLPFGRRLVSCRVLSLLVVAFTVEIALWP